MLVPPPGLRGWKVTTIGDDIAWIKPQADGSLRAINPEAGFFGVAPRHQLPHQPQLHGQPGQNVIFTNVALTDDGDVGGRAWKGHRRHARAT